MEEVKGFWLKDLIWAPPEKVTKKDDIHGLLKERLVALHMIEMCSLHAGEKSVKKITEWTQQVYRPRVSELKELITAFNETKPLQFKVRKMLKIRGVELLNTNIKNVTWVSEVSEKKQSEVLGDSETWSLYEEIAERMLLGLDSLGK